METLSRQEDAQVVGQVLAGERDAYRLLVERRDQAASRGSGCTVQGYNTAHSADNNRSRLQESWCSLPGRQSSLELFQQVAQLRLCFVAQGGANVWFGVAHY